MFETFLADLSEDSEPLGIDSYVALIRRHSNHVLYLQLKEISVGKVSQVECRWKDRITYRLNLETNTVHAIECKPQHVQDMKQWYYVWEPHRLKLIQLCEQERIKEKKRKKKLQWKSK
jgi:hypothetical protein